MAKKLDQIIVIDVEATCWEGSPPRGQQSEIIEIGVCPLEVASGRRLGRQSILVRPERSSVSAFCTRLTTLTQEQVADGISFEEACSLLKRQYLIKERIWASYGDYDRQQFEWQCQTCALPFPFGSRHLNIKSLLAIIHALPLEVGMAEALQLVGLPLEGVHHRGGDDAWNIAAILAAILQRARSSLVT